MTGLTVTSARTGEIRIRVGHYRVVHEMIDDEIVILVLRIGHRRAIYR